MPIWSDFFKLFTYAGESDPLSKMDSSDNFQGAGITQPDALTAATSGPNISPNLRQTTEFIDTTSLTNRTMRYKEYERLRNIPEIETAITVFSDEACLTGDTKVATPFGFISIKDLAESNNDERFLVYCYDFKKNDYSFGWAFSPRYVKDEETVTIIFDNGKTVTCTKDHRILKRDGTWSAAGDLKLQDELMPFYRKEANVRLTNNKQKQFPRIFTFNLGWINEHQFLDYWKEKKIDEKLKTLTTAMKMVGADIPVRKIEKSLGRDWQTLENWMHNEGFSHKETKQLFKNEDKRVIVGIHHNESKVPVYDLSVEEHKCFATDSIIVHNCQKDDTGNILKVSCLNEDVKKEIEFLLLHRKMLNLNRNAWSLFKGLCLFGDLFLELVINPNNPKEGIYKATSLPPETMFRIETVKGKLLEFQQAKDAPDYQAIVKGSPLEDTKEDPAKSTAIRFAPNQIVHFKIGDDRKTFFPYGQSLIEPARGPAHSLRLLEDAMVIYRLTRAPERRVFYIDVGQLPPFKAEAFLDRVKDQFRKRKIANGRSEGANQVDERWQPPAQDEDYWLPTRPNSNTRIETLPGAENLGEIDDAVYFRNKLLIALNFPKNYFNSEDPNSTRFTLSAQDVKFARMIERLQSNFEDGLLEIAEQHLYLRGFPDSSFQDLKIKMTPPSDWRELSRSDVVTARYNNATTLKGGALMSDYDVMTKILKYNPEETEEMLARLKVQKLEELKLQVLAQNPQLLGVGIPGQEEDNQEIGVNSDGPNVEPNLETDPSSQLADEGQDQEQEQDQIQEPNSKEEPIPLEDPSKDDIKKYDLEIQGYETDQDHEDIDYSIGDF